VFDAAWELDRCDGATAQLHCELASSGGRAGTDRDRDGWPFGGIARQTIVLTDSAVRCELSVESGDEPFPAAIGWHPWFLKPDRLTFDPRAMYRRDGIGLPHAELVEPIGGPWDDTFVNTDPVALHYPARTHASTVTVTSDCDHWVVYDLPAYATCVEPQSGPPDALTVQPRLVTTDAPLHRWMEISWV
jgi:aldose 1-epimerase